MKSCREIIEELKDIMTSWNRLTLSELLLVLTIIISLPLGVLIFKLALAGKIKWGHIFWFVMLFG